MTMFRIGEVIRIRRKSLGISQERLAEGICSVATLSRIENGERLPNKSNFNALMQRLGASGEMYDAYVSKYDFVIHQKKYLIRQATYNENYEEAEKELASILKYEGFMEKVDRRFIMYMKEIISKRGEYSEETLSIFEEAIRMTIPNYGSTNLHECLLGGDEVILLNHIGNNYGYLGEVEKAITILRELKLYLEKEQISYEDNMKLYILTLNNLAKWLCRKGYYNECIEICDMGIKVSRYLGMSNFIDQLLYNKSCCLLKVGKKEEAKEQAMQLHHFALIFQNRRASELCKQVFLKSNSSV